MKKPVHNLQLYIGDDIYQYLVDKKQKTGILSLSSLGRYYLLLGLAKDNNKKNTSEFVQQEIKQ